MIIPGNVVVRFLPQYQVWHWGIVVGVIKHDLDNIHVMEFSDTNTISLVTLREFCWYRKYFWIHTFSDEFDLYGRSVFNPPEQAVRIAYQLFRNNILTYNIARQNCEYFVRRCIFNTPLLWESNQTDVIGKSKILLMFKLTTVMLAALFFKFGEMLEYERDQLPQHIRYRVCDDSVNIRQDSQII